MPPTNRTKKARDGKPSVSPNSLKVNTVRRGRNGYWWIVVKADDVRYSIRPPLAAIHIWMPLGNHKVKNGQTRQKRMEMPDDMKERLDDGGIIQVLFNLTPHCEKTGKLPKTCDLEKAWKHLSKPLQHTEWSSLHSYEYASNPTDTYKYIHTYNGSLKAMKEVEAVLAKHYGQHKRDGGISEFTIKATSRKDYMKQFWYW
jgi:hypothetical protein